jgi:hypothetical protein
LRSNRFWQVVPHGQIRARVRRLVIDVLIGERVQIVAFPHEEHIHAGQQVVSLADQLVTFELHRAGHAIARPPLQRLQRR